MTTAPTNLKNARALLLEHLDIHENSSAYSTDLDPAEVGIVGDSAHRGGYHCGSDRVVSGDYSVVESSRDRTGLTLAAAALDIGWFDITVDGRRHTLRTFSAWLVAECVAGAADTLDIREVIYSLDGKTVKRWDRLKRRTAGDSSHTGHTHISIFRDAIKAGRDLTSLFRRYLSEIGLIDMALSTDDLAKVRNAVALGIYDILYVASTGKDFNGLKFTGSGSVGQSVKLNLGAVAAAPAVAAVDALAARVTSPPPVDAEAVALSVAAKLVSNPDFLAAIAKAVNDDDARRMAS